MEQNEQPLHPPTDPVPIVRPALGSSWPGVLGAIAIAFGVLGILQGGMGVLSSMMMEFFATLGTASGAPGDAGMGAMAKYKGWMIVTSLMTSAVAGLLLAGGIGLVRRAPWGRTVMLWWAGVKMVFAIASVGFTYVMQRDQMAAMQAQMAQQNAAAMPMMAMTQTITVVTVVLGLLWAWALPVFTIVWLSRAKIREEVRSWSVPRGFVG